MNVYDFDGTIFYSDCSIGFALWCIRRHPKLWVTYLPGMLGTLIKHKLGKLPNYQLQRRMFSYLTMIDDFDEQIERYWDKYESRISDWYLAQKRPDDLIISASPDCIIGPIAKRLGVKYMATEYDREYGVLLDEIGIYLDRVKVTDVESRYLSLYDYLSDEVSKVPPGANCVIFTPWLHGNRCPFEDSNTGGIFFNIRVENGKRDITGRTIETVGNSQEVGAVGTALVVAAGIKGEDVLTLAKRLVKVNRVYQPDASNKAVYEKNYRVFKRLYRSNARNFSMINGG